MKYKFIVHGIGDRSVGIPPAQAEITIDDTYLEDFTEEWREQLAEWYDEPKWCVFTEQEWENYLEDCRKYD